jgi:glycosyltransferase involved in cell wall biosynthesis
VDKRTTIIHCIAKLELGGAQLLVLETIRRLPTDRYRHILISGTEGLLIDEARALPNATFIPLHSLVREIRPLSDLRAILALYRLLVAERNRSSAILLHTHGSKAGVIGRLAGRLARVPVIHTIHGFAFHEYQPFWVRMQYLLPERACGPMAARLIAVSEATRRKGLAAGVGRTGQYAVVQPGIDLASIHRQNKDALREEFGLGSGPVVGTVACFKPQKAPLDFVKVAALVARRVPEVQFVMIGDGVLRPSAELLAQKLGVRDQIAFLGWQRDAVRIIGAFDVFLLVSLWEGLPLVLGEAQALGVPVVATRVDGSPEAIVDGVTGWLVDPHDVEGTAAQVMSLVTDHELAQSMGASGQRMVAERFDINRMVREVECIYDQVLVKPRSEATGCRQC